MTPEQTAYLATCGLMFAVGLGVFLLGALASRLTNEYADWPGLVIGLGFLCMVVGPLMLIGFPVEQS